MGSDWTQDTALGGVALAVERAPRPTMLVDDKWQVLLANREARALPGVTAGVGLPEIVRDDPQRITKSLSQAMATSRGVPLRLTFGKERMAFQAWRMDPVPGTDGAMVMLQSDPANMFAARLNALERQQINTRERLSLTEDERDRLRRTARHLADLAQTDPLTGLLNARGFRRAGKRLLRDPEMPVGVLYLDLNGFKPINDQFGHQTGDAVLRKVAERLRARLREGDIIARMGGDEFAIWMPGSSDSRLVQRIADLRNTLAPPMTLNLPDDTTAILPRIDGSFGHASAPEDGITIDEILHRADARMYDDKTRRGGSRLRMSG